MSEDFSILNERSKKKTWKQGEVDWREKERGARQESTFIYLFLFVYYDFLFYFIIIIIAKYFLNVLLFTFWNYF